MKKRFKLSLFFWIVLCLIILNACTPNDKTSSYNTYKVEEKHIENVKRFKGIVIPHDVKTIPLDTANGSYDLQVKVGDQVKKEQVLVKYKNTSNQHIKSPIDGVVASITKDIDEKTKSPGITIYAHGPLKIKGELSEYELSQMKVAQRVTIMSKAIPNKKWEGAVKEIALMPLKNIGDSTHVSNYPFVVQLDNNNTKELQSGFHVYIDNKLGEATGTIVPKSSIVNKGDKNIVFVVKDGKVKEQAVTAEFETDHEAKVTGIQKGEQIISKPEKELKDGMEVNIK
ncbi:HlyD family efflux transporter periplasmic adaptor subunit [Bacillus sp. CDB3]|uniref:HlyD family efflux transporter periplasmic adaptor subunit n=1 Tax=Bacillus sp. CDB3 TaxID=360310 RepID=UPI0009D7C84C|nr:HlyD family efflux transporter periplasmic adaptor subunit [Bacillus sp. CDB3]OQR53288.1 hypothetical protein CDB3_31065 [Bacillus sp. CDB3]